MNDLERQFHEHATPLFRYLVRLTGDPDLAADGVQDTFVRLLERKTSASVERAWLYKVATNCVFEERRTTGRRRRLLGAHSEQAPLADPQQNPLERVEALERHDRALRALTVLSQKERTALLMREEGFAHHEIADVVDTTTGSVGTLIARALIKFTAALPPGSADA